MKKVTVYSSATCPYCIMARNLLKKKGVEPEIRDISEHSEYIDEAIEKSGGRTTVPQVFIGNHHVGGFDDLNALEKKGELDALLRE